MISNVDTQNTNIPGFQKESLQLLNSWKEECIHLCDNSDKTNLGNIINIFRSLKGEAENAQLQEFSWVVQKLEDILIFLEKQNIKPNPDFISFLQKCHEVLTEWALNVNDTLFIPDLTEVYEMILSKYTISHLQKAYLNVKHAEKVSDLKKTVLVVDDDTDILDLVEKFLFAQCSVSKAASFSDAVELLSQQKYDLIISDLNLEKSKSGLSLLQAVNKIRENQDFVIITGAHTSEFQKNVARKHGCHWIINKPFSKAELEKIIRKVDAQREKDKNKQDNVRYVAFSKEKKDPSQLSILMLDQDEAFRSGIVESLQGKFHIIPKIPPKEVLKITTNEEVNLLIVNYTLQEDFSGIDLLGHLHKEGLRIPSILISELDLDEDTIKSAKRLGCIYFLKKPFEKFDIEAVVIQAKLKPH